jgi:hypothetical protein
LKTKESVISHLDPNNGEVQRKEHTGNPVFSARVFAEFGKFATAENISFLGFCQWNEVGMNSEPMRVGVLAVKAAVGDGEVCQNREVL